MRYSKRYQILWTAVGLLALGEQSRADFTYNFDGLTGSPNPGTQLTPATSIGASGQDNWFLSAGPTTPPVVRNDPQTGFSGNYLTSVVTPNGGNTSDTVVSRAGANLGLGTSQFAVFQFDGLVGTGFLNSSGASVARRSWIGPGYDSNNNGNVRGTAVTRDNNEAGFLFGYESSSPAAGWFVRQAAFSNTGSVSGSTTAQGLYTIQLVVNFAANPVTGGADGSGTLYVKQLADANGNPVSDVFRVASAATSNVNLGITTNMTSAANNPVGATSVSNNPSLWNGIFARVGSNGGLDNITINAGTASLTPAWAGNGVGGAGDWLAATNWTYTGVPNAVDAIANFTAGANADATVYADSPVTVGTLKFNNTFTYVLSGNGSLTLQASTGSALVDVQSSNVQKINLPLFVASNANFNIASGGTLKISDPMTVNSGASLTQTGAGSIVYESNVSLQPTSSVALGSNTSMHALSVSGGTGAWTSTVDTSNHTLVLRTGSLATVVDQLKSGLNGGSWNGTGIKSSAAASNSAHNTAIGYGTGATILGLSGSTQGTYDGQTVDASSLILKYTWNGDANLDGKVNTADFMAVANNFGATGKAWQTGDFNYDGVVNALDFNAIATNFGQTSPPATLALGSVVPEPCTVGVLLTAMTGMLIRRRRSA